MLGEDKMKKNWEQFAVHFDKVHSDFLVSLKAAYPNLTPSELKLCAYLRLSLSSKEIAQIMNITIKSVELGRHRLRKKLGIEPNITCLISCSIFTRKYITTKTINMSIAGKIFFLFARNKKKSTALLILLSIIFLSTCISKTQHRQS